MDKDLILFGSVQGQGKEKDKNLTTWEKRTSWGEDGSDETRGGQYS